MADHQRLPKYVVFTSRSKKTKFFRPNGPASLLKYEDAGFWSPGVKHEIVYSKSAPGNVHIKCVDTGKYWSWCSDSSSKDYIAAQATEPSSDKSSSQCTLVTYSCYKSGGDNVFKLSFLRKSEWHAIRKSSEEFLKNGETEDSAEYFKFIIKDWEKLAKPNENPKPNRNPKKIDRGGAPNGNQKKIAGGGAPNGNQKKIDRAGGAPKEEERRDCRVDVHKKK